MLQILLIGAFSSVVWAKMFHYQIPKVIELCSKFRPWLIFQVCFLFLFCFVFFFSVFFNPLTLTFFFSFSLSLSFSFHFTFSFGQTFFLITYFFRFFISFSFFSSNLSFTVKLFLTCIFFFLEVKTPTLILLGDDDKRVPPFQGKSYFNSLQRNGVKSKWDFLFVFVFCFFFFFLFFLTNIFLLPSFPSFLPFFLKISKKKKKKS